jgi:hypothetical protein
MVDDPDPFVSPWSWRARLYDAALYAGAGVALSAFFVLVGLSRWTVAALAATLRGNNVSAPGTEDGRFLAAYVGAFALGGALLGLIAPLLGAHAAKVLAGAVVGAVGMAAVEAVDTGGFAALPREELIIELVVGGMFGALGGLVIGAAGRSARNLEEMDRRQADIDAMVAARRRGRERLERQDHAPDRDSKSGESQSDDRAG